MASIPANSLTPARMSFAQVAAAGRSPQNINQKASENGVIEAASQPPNLSQSIFIASPSTDEQVQPVLPIAVNPDRELAQAQLPSTSANGAGASHKLIGMLKATTLDEGNMQLSAYELAKKDTSDTKSVASRITFTMEEKESLRPDDSASMQAAVDEDVSSAPGSCVAVSQVASDADVRAFKDQLREINQTRPPNQLLPRPNGLFAASTPQNGGIIYTNSVQGSPFQAVSNRSEQQKMRGLPDGAVIPPDEKLLDALRSPKDRVFVLKIEQDIIDFVKDPKEQQLHLPQMNSFYRMLTHKLADYYLLEHAVDDSMTSVRLFRTASSRLPPPLIGINSSTTNPNTPPPTARMKKIMRRGIGGNDPQSTISSSQNPSKSVSEVGTGSNSEDGNSDPNRVKDKAAMTREEREKAYYEARARIFQDFKAEETAAGEAIADGKLVSRASSASESKNAKIRNNKDDGFEARSAYTQYLPHPVAAPCYSLSDTPNYGAYPSFNTSAQYPQPYVPEQQMSAAAHGQNGSPGQMQSYNWQYTPFTPGYPGPQNGHSPDQSAQYGYGSPGSFPNNLQQFPSPSMASQATPKMTSPLPANYGTNYQTQSQAQDQMQWPQMGFQPPYAVHGYGPLGHNGAATDQGTGAAMYPYPAMNMSGYPPYSQPVYGMQSLMAMNMHRQFNPLSNDFIPGTSGGGPPPFLSAGGYNGNIGNFHSSVHLQRQISNNSHSSAMSPHFGYPTPNGHNGYPQSPARSMNLGNRNAKPNQSSISKWGTPSTLPPKPPPPATPYQSQQSKDSQLPLPPHPSQSLARQQANNISNVPASSS